MTATRHPGNTHGTIYYSDVGRRLEENSRRAIKDIARFAEQ